MNTDIELEKSLLSPPGDTIQETIDAMGMSQAELAERIGRPKEKLNDVIKGREPISTETAYRLEKALGIPASFWINRETKYRREVYEIEQQERLFAQQDWLKCFPLKEMKRYGWISDIVDKNHLVAELLTFYGVASTNEWERIYIAKEVAVAFRISLANTKSPHAISAWLRQGEIDAEKLTVKEYNKSAFKEALKEIKKLVNQFPDDFAAQLQKLCAHCGVAVSYVPTLPKAPISGASRWYRGRPLIQLSGRYRTDDRFWFTFYHEAAHILLHGKKEIFLENVEGTELDKAKEDEADNFAASNLLTEKQLRIIIDAAPHDPTSIKHYADEFNTSPGVIIGRLQHLQLIPWSLGNELMQKVELFPDLNT
ncbi:MAG TPA: HigA family addiction module antitoxin [Fulvivirga sp.]|nr:HigA family addiction module antitoxin [Fulvivirga sp.]